MTEIETRAYIKELSSKPVFWIKDAKGGYFDIESFGLALIEVFTKSVIEDYKVSLVPVGIFRGDFKGAVNGKVEMSVIAINGIPETGTKLYALGETK